MKLQKILLLSIFSIGLLNGTGCQSEVEEEESSKEEIEETVEEKEEKKVDKKNTGMVEGEEVSKIFLDPDAFKGRCWQTSGRIFGLDENEEGQTVCYVCTEMNHNEKSVVLLGKPDLFNNLEMGDFVKVSGQIDGCYTKEEEEESDILPYPQMTVDQIEKSSYKEAYAPTIREIKVNQTVEDEGTKITLQKVELAKEETRVYLCVDSSATDGYFLDPIRRIVQGSKQYIEVASGADPEDPEYKVLEPVVSAGTKEEGVLLFKPIREESFQFIFRGTSGENVLEFKVNMDE